MSNMNIAKAQLAIICEYVWEIESADSRHGACDIPDCTACEQELTDIEALEDEMCEGYFVHNKNGSVIDIRLLHQRITGELYATAIVGRMRPHTVHWWDEEDRWNDLPISSAEQHALEVFVRCMKERHHVQG